MTGFTFDLTKAAITRAKFLTGGGALPFLGALVLEFYPIPPLNAAQLASTYAALIIAFVAGTQWGLFLTLSQKSPINLMIQSNLVTLIAWVALLFLPFVSALALHAACFLYLLFLDYKLFKSDLLPYWYFSLRRFVTIIVVSLLAVLGAVVSH